MPMQVLRKSLANKVGPCGLCVAARVRGLSFLKLASHLSHFPGCLGRLTRSDSSTRLNGSRPVRASICSARQNVLGTGLAIWLSLPVIIVLLMPGRAFAYQDAWYSDLSFHWARQYVRVLWEEGVTDGYIPSYNLDIAYFRPDVECTRAQLATLLCKTFSLPPVRPNRPSYPDVPTYYKIFWDKPAFQWIEGALAGGISFVPPGSYFMPDNYITREDAVELLIRSLDLSEYAASLPTRDVDAILSRFPDQWKVSSDRRDSMAVAAKFGIIKGYEDGTIRPKLEMLRGEAATVVARSCLIRIAADKLVFSPDGDGIDDSVTFSLTYLRNRGISQWQAVVEDSQGKPVAFFNPDNVCGYPPATIVWSGLGADGKLVPSGQYYYQAWVQDPQGRQFFSVKKPLTVERHLLQAWVSPPECLDGQDFTVVAETEPQADSVSMLFADGITRYPRASTSRTHWELTLKMGAYLPLGRQNVVVRSWFPGAYRQVTVGLTRLEDVWIDPSLSPNPASWGQTVSLNCRASGSIKSVSATIFGSSVSLSMSANRAWSASTQVPWGIAPGTYPAVFTGTSSGSTIVKTVLLSVQGPGTEGLTYFLSK